MRSEQILRSADAANSPAAFGRKFSRPYNLFPPAMPALLGDMIATSRGISPPHFSAFNPLLADCLPIASRRVLFPPAFGTARLRLLDKVDIMWQTTRNFSERGAIDAYIP